MKHIKIILGLILLASVSTFAQSPRIKLNQITKDTVKGSVLISSPSDSGMVYSRDLFISYGTDTFLILGGDTLAATSSIIHSVLSDGVTITGDGTTGSELTVDTSVLATLRALSDSLALVISSVTADNVTITGDGTVGSPLKVDTSIIATQGDLSDYVTIAGTETITGAKTFTNALTQSGGDVNFDGGTLYVDATNNRVGIGKTPSYLLDLYKEQTMSTTVDRALQLQDILTYSGTLAKYQQSIFASGRHLVPTGSTNNGYLRGISFDVTTGYGDAGNSGSLAEITGMQFQVGIESLNSNAPTVTNVTGLNIWPFYQSGSITNLYGIKLQNALTGGSVTNYYGIYQEDANAKNYFNGNVGIGTTSPAEKLHVVGNIVATGTITPSYSDANLKTNIVDLQDGLNVILDLKPKTFNFISDNELGLEDDLIVGLVAQDVEQSLSVKPYLNSVIKQIGEYKAIDVHKIIPITVKAIQEQQAIIETQEQKITDLETTIQSLITRIENLENK